MKMACKTAVLAALAATVTCDAVNQTWEKKDIDVVDQEFQHFIKKWGKVYASEEETLHRLEAFRDNYWYVMHENSKGNTFELELNEFADQTPDEFAATHFGVNPKTMWKTATYLGTHNFSGVAPPASVDWVKKGAVTPVKNQGSCGSCWTFSTTGALEGAWAIATGKLVSLSEQQFVDCSHSSPNSGCNGGNADIADKYAEFTPICTESSYSYKGKEGICHASACQAGIPRGSVRGYKDVQSTNVRAMMEAVAQQPCSVSINADGRALQLYKSGVLTGSCSTKLDHAVLAVGYGTLRGVNYWKVKNSWGASWGMGGYILIQKGRGGQGECGIEMKPSYPVVSKTPGPLPSHYQKPPNCMDDEAQVIYGGSAGRVCAPKCGPGGRCPTDVPAGTRNRAQCVIQLSGSLYCGLTCSGGGCPSGAKCVNIGAHSICLYQGAENEQNMQKEVDAVEHELIVGSAVEYEEAAEKEVDAVEHELMEEHSASTSAVEEGLSPVMKKILDRHNKYRCMHGVPLFKWNDAIAKNAAAWAVKAGGQMVHSPQSFRSHVGGFSYVGENLAWGTGVTSTPAGVDMWYNEIKQTHGGIVPNFMPGTGHYTQVVWKSSTNLGCGVFKQLLVCQYGPGGNMMGQFTSNVNGPKKSSSQCPGEADSPSEQELLESIVV